MGLGPNWTDFDVSRLHQLYGKGQSHAEMAAVLGRTKSAVSSKCQDLGLVSANHAARRPRKHNAKLAAKVIAAYGGDESATKVGQRLGISRGAVCGFWNRAKKKWGLLPR